MRDDLLGAGRRGTLHHRHAVPGRTAPLVGKRQNLNALRPDDEIQRSDRRLNRDVLDWLFTTFDWEVDRRVPLLVLVWLVALVVGLFLWYVTSSPWGRVLRAVREDEDAAAAVGKPVFSYKLQALAVGGAVAALAGVLFTFAQTTLYPENFLPIVTFTGFAILILGGLGSILGVVAASVVVTFLVDGSVLIDLPIDPEQVAALRFVLIGLVIMLIMAFRPQGIFGKKEELHLGE